MVRGHPFLYSGFIIIVSYCSTTTVNPEDIFETEADFLNSTSDAQYEYDIYGDNLTGRQKFGSKIPYNFINSPNVFLMTTVRMFFSSRNLWRLF